VPSIVVSEFGFADPYESAFNTLGQILWDLRRADYIQGFMDGILAARVLDGVNVTGAFAWAIYDSECTLPQIILSITLLMMFASQTMSGTVVWAPNSVSNTSTSPARNATPRLACSSS